MLPSEELAIIHKKQLDVVAEEVITLFDKFVKVSPVDTGAFKGAWAIKKNKLSWIITNDMEYATILFTGRRKAGNKEYGSKQWPEGGDPILMKFNRTLKRRLKKVKA